MQEMSALSRTDEGDLCILRITRPQSLNALNRRLLLDFSREFDEISRNPNLRALIITAEGDRAFCAGADLKERRDMSLEQTREFVQSIGNVFRQLERLEIPTIAVLNGSAFGGGLELALACDVRIAVHNAKMGLTECALGIMPGAGGTQRLPRLLGASLAKKMIFTAQVIGSEEALKIHLITAIAEDVHSAMREAKELIAGIRRCAPLSIKASKRAINLGADLELDKGLELEWRAYETLIGTDDRVEGLRAFAEKRTPAFLGR